MSLCTIEQAAARIHARHERLKRLGWTTEVMRAYDIEHEWRCAGEYAIRLEMERRLALRFPVLPLPKAG